MKKSPLERLSKKVYVYMILLFVFSILGACHKIPEPTGKVQNPESQLLTVLLQPIDIPGDWEFSAFSIYQPSQVEWIDTNGLFDSASVDIAGSLKDNQKNFYISIYQVVLQYEKPVSEIQLFEITSTFHDVVSSFAPELDISVTAQSMCFETSTFIECNIIVQHDRFLVFTSLITPVDFGEQATVKLLKTIFQASDDKFETLQSQ